MKKIIVSSFCFVLLSICLFSCKKKDESTSNTQPEDISFENGLYIAKSSDLQLNFNYVFNQNAITFNDKKYVNAAKDTFTIEDLKHYFSNFSIQKADSTWIRFNNCNLIDVKNGRNVTLTIPNLPAGNYRAIAFDLGVDKVKNSSMSLMGDLDPAWGMYWTWSTGYVFFRIMGRVPSTNDGYSLDLGGDNNLPHLEIPLTGFKVKSEKPQLNIQMDLNEMFQTPSLYDFSTDGMVIHSNTSPGANKLAKNMLDMASVTAIK
jgi:hypothetical protein